MSRSGYVEDCDDVLQYGRWRGQLKSAMRGKRGQAFFRDLVDALEAMPEKSLIAEELIKDGEVCALGALGLKRGMTNLDKLNPQDSEVIGAEFGIAHQLACEVVYQNDEHDHSEKPKDRWKRMHAWALSKLKAGDVTSDAGQPTK